MAFPSGATVSSSFLPRRSVEFARRNSHSSKSSEDDRNPYGRADSISMINDEEEDSVPRLKPPQMVSNRPQSFATVFGKEVVDPLNTSLLDSSGGAIVLILAVMAFSIVWEYSSGLVGVIKLFFIVFSGIGALCSVGNAKDGMGKEWLAGLETLPDLFLAIGGALAGFPVLANLFLHSLSWAYGVGSNPSVVVNFFLAIDMGGEGLAKLLAESPAEFLIGCIPGYSMGVTFSFSLPIALALLKRSKQRNNLVLGIVPGICCVPISCGLTCLLFWFMNEGVDLTTVVPSSIANKARADPLINREFTFDDVFSGTLAIAIPCWTVALFCMILAKVRLCALLQGFSYFGTGFDLFLRSCFWLSLLQQIGGQRKFFERHLSMLLMDPLFPVNAEIDPKMKKDYDATALGPQLGQETGLEIACSIVLILTGVYPFVWILREKLISYFVPSGRALGFDDPSGNGILGAFACMSNSVCLLQLVADERAKVQAKECVMAYAYMVNAAFALGDYLVYASLYQPYLLGPLVIGKIVGGICAVFLARMSTCKLLTEEDLEDQEGMQVEDQVGTFASRFPPNTAVTGAPSPNIIQQKLQGIVANRDSSFTAPLLWNSQSADLDNRGSGSKDRSSRERTWEDDLGRGGTVRVANTQHTAKRHSVLQ